MQNKYNYNKTFFENIDTQEKAYVLGLMYADGWIQKRKGSYKLCLSLHSQDKDLVFAVAKLLSTDKQPYYWSCRDLYDIEISCKQMVEDLEKWGVTQAKTFTITFPNFLEKNLIPHFIRGYFDGDGCVWEGKRKYMHFPTKNKTIHNVKFHITSNLQFLEGLRETLCDAAKLSKVKIEVYKKSPQIGSLPWSGRNNLRKFYNYIYKDATIYMSRKKEKFEKILCFQQEIAERN